MQGTTQYSTVYNSTVQYSIIEGGDNYYRFTITTSSIDDRTAKPRFVLGCPATLVWRTVEVLATVPSVMGKAKKSRAVRVKFAQAKRLLTPKDSRLKSNIERDEEKRKKVRG